MIRVASPIAEPATFDAQCRQPGIAWLVTSRLANSLVMKERPRDYWSNFREALREGFVRRCGYFAMYLPEGTVDHFISWETCKNVNPQMAYEWNNFRFIAPSLNSKKGTLDDRLLDPFEVEDGWFEMDIPSFVLRITNRIPGHLRPKAEFTMDRLDLQQGRKAVTLRWEWYDLFRSGALSFEGLKRCAPLVARAVDDWRLNGRGSLPVIPRPFANVRVE